MLATQPEEITVCLLYVPHNLEAKQKISVILGLGIQYLVASCTTEHFLLELMGPLRGIQIQLLDPWLISGQQKLIFSLKSHLIEYKGHT